MQEQANRVVVTDEELKKRLEDYLVAQICQGGERDVRDWLSNEVDGESFSGVLHRNKTTKKIDWVAFQLEKALFKYMKSLVDGFSSEEKSYLEETAMGRKRVVVPTYTMDEATVCLNQLIYQKTVYAQERLDALLMEHLGQEQYAAMWEAAGVDVSETQPMTTQLPTRFNRLLPVWRLYYKDPVVFTERRWVNSLQNASKSSFALHMARMLPRRGEHIDLTGGVAAAFTRASQEIEAHKNDLVQRQQECLDSLRTSLTGGLAQFGQVPEGVEQVAYQSATGRAIYEETVRRCKELANLEAEKEFMTQYHSLHNLQAMKPVDKLVAFVEHSGNEEVIPIDGMMELRYHVEFLRQLLPEYCREMALDLLLRANHVTPEGQLRSLGEAQRREIGEDIAGRLAVKLGSLFNRLEKLDCAEAKRSSVIGDLAKIRRILLKKLRLLTPQVRRAEEISLEEDRSFARQHGYEHDLQKRRLLILAGFVPNEEGVEVNSFADLLALYEPTQVTEQQLSRLVNGGFTDKSQLLYRAVKQSDRPDRIEQFLLLLNEGTAVDSREDDVQLLAWAHEKTVEGDEGTDEQAINWQVYALLVGAKKLFEEGNQNHFLQSGVRRILAAVRRCSGVRSIDGANPYQARDGLLVANILRRLTLSLYLRRLNKDAVHTSPLFQQLCAIWEYLGTDTLTPQILPGARYPVDQRRLKSAILRATLMTFKVAEYTLADSLREHLLRSTPESSRVATREQVEYGREISAYKARVEERRRALVYMQRLFQAQLRFLQDGGNADIAAQMRVLMNGPLELEVPAQLQIEDDEGQGEAAAANQQDVRVDAGQRHVEAVGGNQVDENHQGEGQGGAPAANIAQPAVRDGVADGAAQVGIFAAPLAGAANDGAADEGAEEGVEEEQEDVRSRSQSSGSR